MKAIRTRYYGWTNTKPSRVVASDSDGHRFSVTANGDFEGDDAHKAAALGLCRKMKWGEDIAGGGYGNTDQFWVFISPEQCPRCGHLNPLQFAQDQIERKPRP